MEVKDLKDFYIDLDGDIKASAGDAKTAVFITNSDKPSSQYVMVENISPTGKKVPFKFDRLRKTYMTYCSI